MFACYSASLSFFFVVTGAELETETERNSYCGELHSTRGQTDTKPGKQKIRVKGILHPLE